jgi:zinc transport system substrate-binding protein
LGRFGARQAAILLLLVFVTVAPAATQAAEGPLRIATSIHPLASIIREVAGDRAEVTAIVPRGADPHHFELTPKAAIAVDQADLVFLIGDSFDAWSARGLSEQQQSRVYEFRIVLEDSLLPTGDSFNPHFWLDPLIAGAMATFVNVVLGTADQPNTGYYQQRTIAFRSRIDSLHTSTRRRIEESGLKTFVALHPAWSYFARRYRLLELATIEVSHEQEPSPRHLTHVISEMRKHDVRVIFAEAFSNPDLAEAVASETGAEIVFLDPLGLEDSEDGASYFELIDHNVSLIEKAGRDLNRQEEDGKTNRRD